MRRFVCTAFIALMLSRWLTWPAVASSGEHKVDGPRSTITVRVSKTGVVSAFGHNHEIKAPVQSGEVNESSSPSVTLRVDASKLRVVDPEASEDTRVQVQKMMRGSQVLDVDRFPEIRFQSTRVEPKGPDHWIVHGNLALHGREHPIAFEVTLKGEQYRGSATLKQTAFGITPVTVAGGTIKVKDEVKVEFEIALQK